MTLRRGLLEYCISQVYPLNYTISDRSLQIWNTFFADAQPGKVFEFLSDKSALAERNFIFIGELPTERKDSYQLSPGNPVIIDKKWSIELTQISRRAVQFSDDKYIEYIDGELSGDRLLVRFWKKGDFFRPIGLRHRRKLSDFFIDLKLSIRMKNETPLVCKDREIIWIAGQRLDDRYKITKDTKKVYRLQFKKDTE
jgi:tRNA(Ile)-lysidine synthase